MVRELRIKIQNETRAAKNKTGGSNFENYAIPNVYATIYPEITEKF
jgi:hypothetical protein